jgi:hypothetical protein
MSDTTVRAPSKPTETEIRPSADTVGAIPTRRTEFGRARRGPSDTSGANALAPVINIDRLYEAPAGTESQMVRALGLLAECVDLLDQARLEANSDAISSDRLVQRVQILLDQLFSCRSIGDGFGLVVNSLHFAFVNLQGIPLSSKQLNSVWRCLKELRTHPALTFDQGLQYVAELEEAGLDIDPSFLDEILEPPTDDESIR